MIDVEVKIVASITGTNQPVTLTIPNAGSAASRPALLIPKAMDGIAAGAGKSQAASATEAGCLAVAQNVVANHFPAGFDIEGAQDPDYQGHVYRNEVWVPIGGGGDFGFSFAITRAGMGRFFQDIRVTDTAGVARLLRAQFFLTVQRA